MWTQEGQDERKLETVLLEKKETMDVIALSLLQA